MTLESHRLKTFRNVWNLQVGECAKRQDQKGGDFMSQHNGISVLLASVCLCLFFLLGTASTLMRNNIHFWLADTLLLQTFLIPYV